MKSHLSDKLRWGGYTLIASVLVIATYLAFFTDAQRSDPHTTSLAITLAVTAFIGAALVGFNTART